MATKLSLPPRVTRSSDAFRVPGASYDPAQVAAADAYNDMLRKRVYADNRSGRADDPMYDVADARELAKTAEIPVRGFDSTLAKRELVKRSEEGEYAVPGYGDQGQFAGGSGGSKPRDEELNAGASAMKRGGKVKKMASGGMTSKVSSASKRADGIATKGKTRGKMY
jgi:hypothetical protein